ncbi:hypothetical protein [Yoonia sp. 2307UL14-13]|uniref:hypothetical protein n=1 Tax=Yoonia sp. 2307UL14-13 TaxID=3126506 RepID=UPI0030997E7B
MMKRFVMAAMMTLVAASAFANPPYRNSVASNDIAFITSDDPNNFNCVAFIETGEREMPKGPQDGLFAEAHVYEARFDDGLNIELWVHHQLGDLAVGYAGKVGLAMGHLPTRMRQTLNHVVILPGDEAAFEEAGGGFFGMFAGNIDTRISNDDLEETVFHETVHVALDRTLGRGAAWRAAQQADGDAITRYAAENLDREDLAESALFAYAYHATPGRLDDSVVRNIHDRMPNRLEVLRQVFEENGPRFQQIAPAKPCS